MSDPSPTMVGMTYYDITAGGQRRIVSEDQAANLREREDLRRMVEGLPVVCTADGSDTIARMDADEARWDRLGEESQDPGWDGLA